MHKPQARSIAAKTADEFASELVTHMRMLKRYAIGLCHNSDLADDLVQDTVMRALASYRASFRPGSNLAALLVTILRNSYYTHCRRARRSVEDPQDLNARLVPAADDQLSALIAKDAIAHMALLPEAHRSVLFLASQGDTMDDIAVAEGVPMGTVKSRLFRARASFASLIEGTADGRKLAQMVAAE